MGVNGKIDCRMNTKKERVFATCNNDGKTNDGQAARYYTCWIDLVFGKCLTRKEKPPKLVMFLTFESQREVVIDVIVDFRKELRSLSRKL